MSETSEEDKLSLTGKIVLSITVVIILFFVYISFFFPESYHPSQTEECYKQIAIQKSLEYGCEYTKLADKTGILTIYIRGFYCKNKEGPHQYRFSEESHKMC